MGTPTTGFWRFFYFAEVCPGALFLS